MEMGGNMVKYTGAQLVEQRSKLTNICLTMMYGKDDFSNIIARIG
jgi:hypothetical protein